MEKNGRPNQPLPKTDPNDQISRKLRQFYDSVQDEEIPERLLDLLGKLDAAEKAEKKARASVPKKSERQ